MKWIDCNERLPDNQAPVIIVKPNGCVSSWYYMGCSDDGPLFYGVSDRDEPIDPAFVSHWMPLPPPPTLEESGAPDTQQPHGGGAQICPRCKESRLHEVWHAGYGMMVPCPDCSGTGKHHHA